MRLAPPVCCVPHWRINSTCSTTGITAAPPDSISNGGRRCPTPGSFHCSAWRIVRYKDATQFANDTNLSLLGAGFTQVVDAARRITLSVSAVAGYERDVGQRIDGDRKLFGVRVGGQTGWGDNVDVYATAGYQPSRFQTRNTIFNEQRADKQSDAAVGAVWRIDRACGRSAVGRVRGHALRPHGLSLRGVGARDELRIRSLDRITFTWAVSSETFVEAKHLSIIFS